MAMAPQNPITKATWVLTSYLVANGVVLPTTGWLARYFGRKRLLLICIGIFTVASALCGLATSLPMLLVARIFQGFGGGALQPIAQAVLLESFPADKRGRSMSFYAMGVVVGFILFLVRELRSDHPIVDLRVLADRNLAIGAFLMFAVGAILYGTTAVLPQFLQNLLGYPTLLSGLVMSPRGLGSIIGSFVSGRIICVAGPAGVPRSEAGQRHFGLDPEGARLSTYFAGRLPGTGCRSGLWPRALFKFLLPLQVRL